MVAANGDVYFIYIHNSQAHQVLDLDFASKVCRYEFLFFDGLTSLASHVIIANEWAVANGSGRRSLQLNHLTVVLAESNKRGMYRTCLSTPRGHEVDLTTCFMKRSSYKLVALEALWIVGGVFVCFCYLFSCYIYVQMET